MEGRPYCPKLSTLIHKSTPYVLPVIGAAKQLEAETKKFLSTHEITDIANPIARGAMEASRLLFGNREVSYDSNKFTPDTFNVPWELAEGALFTAPGIIVERAVMAATHRHINPNIQVAADVLSGASSYYFFTQILGPIVHTLLQTEGPITIPLITSYLSSVALTAASYFN